MHIRVNEQYQSKIPSSLKIFGNLNHLTPFGSTAMMLLLPGKFHLQYELDCCTTSKRKYLKFKCCALYHTLNCSECSHKYLCYFNNIMLFYKLPLLLYIPEKDLTLTKIIRWGVLQATANYVHKDTPGLFLPGAKTKLFMLLLRLLLKKKHILPFQDKFLMSKLLFSKSQICANNFTVNITWWGR